MSMKISGDTQINGGVEAPKNSRKTGNINQPYSSNKTDSYSSSIKDETYKLHQIGVNAVRSGSNTRDEKVQMLESKLNANEYNVQGPDVADSICKKVVDNILNNKNINSK